MDCLVKPGNDEFGTTAHSSLRAKRSNPKIA
jgi:hypothetical protein